MGNRGVRDEDHLAYATSLGRAIFTHNIKDFARLARSWNDQGKRHMGIIVSEHAPPWELCDRFQVLFDAYPDPLPELYIRLPQLAHRK